MFVGHNNTDYSRAPSLATMVSPLVSQQSTYSDPTADLYQTYQYPVYAADPNQWRYGKLSMT